MVDVEHDVVVTSLMSIHLLSSMAVADAVLGVFTIIIFEFLAEFPSWKVLSFRVF